MNGEKEEREPERRNGYKSLLELLRINIMSEWVESFLGRKVHKPLNENFYLIFFFSSKNSLPDLFTSLYDTSYICQSKQN